MDCIHIQVQKNQRKILNKLIMAIQMEIKMINSSSIIVAETNAIMD